jgi:hypothetical protein
MLAVRFKTCFFGDIIVGRTKTNLSNEDFVKAYMAVHAKEGTFEDLAVETKMVAQSAYQRANKLSKAGLDLPKMPLKPKKTLDVDALKAIVAAYAEPKQEENVNTDADNQTYVDA